MIEIRDRLVNVTRAQMLAAVELWSRAVKLKRRIDKSEFDGLPYWAREHYIEVDNGDWLLDVVNDETSALKNALSRARDERNAIRERLAAIREVFGTDDFDECRRLQSAAEAKIAAASELMNEAGFNDKLAEMDRQFEADKLAAETRYNEAKRAANAELLHWHTRGYIDAAMTQAGVRGDARELLRPHVETIVRAESDDPMLGVSFKVVDREGVPRQRADGSPMNVAEVLESWRVLDPALSVCFNEPTAARIASTLRNGVH